MNHIVLTRDVLNVAAISDKVSADSCGAVSLFVGTTRDSFEGKKVVTLEYEAYEPMALKKIEQICTQLRSQWPDIVNIAIYHRLGLVGIREASVVIAISSPHRKTSLEAVAVAIDDLKKHVPIWKKEIYNENESAWKENKECRNVCGDKKNIFNDSMCEIEDPHLLPNQLVQISAGEDEINRRIQCFVEKKRDEIDFCNIMDYTDIKEIPRIKYSNQTNSENQPELDDNENTNETMTCARVNSVIIKQEYSKCHLKVKRMENNVGPQIRPNYFNTLDKLMHSIENEKGTEAKKHIGNKMESAMLKYPTIIERLENIEDHLNLPHSEIKNIYKRLKIIENRLLYLESISPEYRHFLMVKSQINDNGNNFEAFNDTTPISGLSFYERKMYTMVKSQINDNGNNFEAFNDTTPISGLSFYERKMYTVNEIDTILQSLEGREFDN